MRTTHLFTLALAFLTACSIDDAPISDAARDAVSVVYPCNLQHETCQAARDVAEATCAFKERCDELWSKDHLQCVADEMASVCGSYAGSCNSSPYDRTVLDACLAAFGAKACGDAGGFCAL